MFVSTYSPVNVVFFLDIYKSRLEDQFSSEKTTICVNQNFSTQRLNHYNLCAGVDELLGKWGRGKRHTVLLVPGWHTMHTIHEICRCLPSFSKLKVNVSKQND